MSLELTRKIGESIIICDDEGNEIRITYVEKNGKKKVRIGIEAPKEYGIKRIDNPHKYRSLERKV